jgi:hypothetical protein
MIRFLKRLFLSVALVGSLLLASAAVQGQQPPPAPAPQNQPAAPAEPKERGAPALQYAVAFISIALIMVIVCMPSRKQ